MKNILALVFLVFIAFSTPSCSKKYGCPADSSQSEVSKDGTYKAGKTKSGLLPKTKHYKGKKSTYQKRKVKHKI